MARGFTLIEVLVAMAIMAFASITLLGASSGQLADASRIETKTLASWIADNKAVEWQMSSLLPSNGKHDERVTMAGREWQVESVIQPTPVAGVRRVDISVAEAQSTGSFQKNAPVTQLTAFVGVSRRSVQRPGSSDGGGHAN